MSPDERARLDAYKADAIAKRDKLRADIDAAVGAEQFDTSKAGQLQKDWLQHEVARLTREILSEKLPYDDYVAKRAKVAAHREFLDMLAKKPATKEQAEAKLQVLNGQLKDISQQQRTS